MQHAGSEVQSSCRERQKRGLEAVLTVDLRAVDRPATVMSQEMTADGLAPAATHSTSGSAGGLERGGSGPDCGGRKGRLGEKIA